MFVLMILVLSTFTITLWLLPICVYSRGQVIVWFSFMLVFAVNYCISWLNCFVMCAKTLEHQYIFLEAIRMQLRVYMLGSWIFNICLQLFSREQW